MNAFEQRLRRSGRFGLTSGPLRVLQVNAGFRCNQSCRHCHLSCGPGRTELMSWPVMTLVRDAARRLGPELIDITGGAPELHPLIRDFVGALREDGHQVQLRTNLSALDEPGHEDLPGFLRDHEVRLAASLPCYTSENVRAQRGDGVFEKSVSVLRKLNGLGYGTGLGPALTLVYNPGGPFLPGDQAGLEADYRRELRGRFGIEFSGLFTIANMPLGRFRNALREEGGLRAYTRLLAEGFNDRTVDQLMCRHQISVAWDGALYDCDFNLALGLPVAEGLPSHVSGLDAGRFEARPIRTGVHCFACTAGAGSSCGGALDRGAN